MRSGATHFQWPLTRTWLGTTRDRAVTQVQDSRLSKQSFIPLVNQGPAANAGNDQYARGYRKQRSRAPTLILLTELREVAIARTARSQMLKPRVSLSKRHLAGRNPPQQLRTGTSNALGIGEFAQQSPPERIQDAPFVFRGIALFVQACLPLRSTSIYTEKIHPVGLSRASWLFLP